jgi:hypothetical protein
MMYLSLRELGFAEEQAGRFGAAISAYTDAAAFEVISSNGLWTWAESSFAVGSNCRALVAFEKLIDTTGPRSEFVRRQNECWAAMKE